MGVTSSHMGNRLTLGRRLLRIGGLPTRERRLLRLYLAARPDGARVGLLEEFPEAPAGWPRPFCEAGASVEARLGRARALLRAAGLLVLIGPAPLLVLALALALGVLASLLRGYPSRARLTVLRRAATWLLAQHPTSLDEELRALRVRLGGVDAAPPPCVVLLPARPAGAAALARPRRARG